MEAGREGGRSRGIVEEQSNSSNSSSSNASLSGGGGRRTRESGRRGTSQQPASLSRSDLPSPAFARLLAVLFCFQSFSHVPCACCGEQVNPKPDSASFQPLFSSSRVRSVCSV